MEMSVQQILAIANRLTSEGLGGKETVKIEMNGTRCDVKVFPRQTFGDEPTLEVVAGPNAKWLEEALRV